MASVLSLRSTAHMERLSTQLLLLVNVLQALTTVEALVILLKSAHQTRSTIPTTINVSVSQDLFGYQAKTPVEILLAPLAKDGTVLDV